MIYERGGKGRLAVALVTEVFHEDPDGESLREHLREARDRGADLAVLPELPLNGWAPATREASAEDAEPPDGPRQQVMAAAAADVGIALLGGAIVTDLRDPADPDVAAPDVTDSDATASDVTRPRAVARYNTALLYSATGTCMASYRKVHLPEEEGYWETSHYLPGDAGPRVVEGLPLRIGLQICSDVNRPQGFQLLAAQGAEVVLAPRATPPGTYDRWRMILRANAVMSGAYLISVNRPRPEAGASIGGPSLAISPTGEVLAETDDPVHVVTLERSVVAEAAAEYPGYLKRFPRVYARGWSELTE